MPDKATDLGRLVSVHSIAPAYVQRAVFIAGLSFLFFLATIFTFYLRQNILYFLLATAFLIVYLITMFSLVMQRRSVVEVCEHGFRFKQQSIPWSEIVAISDEGTVDLGSGKRLILARSLVGFEGLIETVRRNSQK